MTLLTDGRNGCGRAVRGSATGSALLAALSALLFLAQPSRADDTARLGRCVHVSFPNNSNYAYLTNNCGTDLIVSWATGRGHCRARAGNPLPCSTGQFRRGDRHTVSSEGGIVASSKCIWSRWASRKCFLKTSVRNVGSNKTVRGGGRQSSGGRGAGVSGITPFRYKGSGPNVKGSGGGRDCYAASATVRC